MEKKQKLGFRKSKAYGLCGAVLATFVFATTQVSADEQSSTEETVTTQVADIQTTDSEQVTSDEITTSNEPIVQGEVKAAEPSSEEVANPDNSLNTDEVNDSTFVNSDSEPITNENINISDNKSLLNQKSVNDTNQSGSFEEIRQKTMNSDNTNNTGDGAYNLQYDTSGYSTATPGFGNYQSIYIDKSKEYGLFSEINIIKSEVSSNEEAQKLNNLTFSKFKQKYDELVEKYKKGESYDYEDYEYEIYYSNEKIKLSESLNGISKKLSDTPGNSLIDLKKGDIYYYTQNSSISPQYIADGRDQFLTYTTYNPENEQFNSLAIFAQKPITIMTIDNDFNEVYQRFSTGDNISDLFDFEIDTFTGTILIYLKDDILSNITDDELQFKAIIRMLKIGDEEVSNQFFTIINCNKQISNIVISTEDKDSNKPKDSNIIITNTENKNSNKQKDSNFITANSENKNVSIQKSSIAYLPSTGETNSPLMLFFGFLSSIIGLIGINRIKKNKVN